MSVLLLMWRREMALAHPPPRLRHWARRVKARRTDLNAEVVLHPNYDVKMGLPIPILQLTHVRQVDLNDFVI